MLETLVSILATLCLAIGAWAITLNAKVNVLEQRHEDLLKLIDSRLGNIMDRLDEKFENLNDRLEGRTGYFDQIPVILSRIDRMERFFNGPFKRFAAKDEG